MKKSWIIVSALMVIGIVAGMIVVGCEVLSDIGNNKKNSHNDNSVTKTMVWTNPLTGKVETNEIPE